MSSSMTSKKSFNYSVFGTRSIWTFSFLLLLLFWVAANFTFLLGNPIVNNHNNGQENHITAVKLNVGEEPRPGTEKNLRVNSAGRGGNSSNAYSHKLLLPIQYPGEMEQSSLFLQTAYGTITIDLRRDLSPGSVDYIHRLWKSRCARCNFYRTYKPEKKRKKVSGMLLGVMANHHVPLNNILGNCPEEFNDVENQCDVWNPNCACHGPVLKKGMVAWTGATAGGPDFLINYNNNEEAIKETGTQYTVFGQVIDRKSFTVLERILQLPTSDNSAAHHVLDDRVHFDLELE